MFTRLLASRSAMRTAPRLSATCSLLRTAQHKILLQPPMRHMSSPMRQQQEMASPEVMAARREAHQMPGEVARGKNRVAYDLSVGQTLHGFKVTSIDQITQFDLKAYKLTHETTGAQWLHLDSSDTDNVFSVMFRTPPDDHTGKPHILEHLATCGSKHYPVRDPFFNMLKRSLNTFMNALTGTDFTMYPFSTQNAQDFRNLLSVYTDMAFAPNLNYYDFRQEGHRLEFVDPEDPHSALMRKGVVYNEMKGAMSDPGRAFMQGLNENLFTKSQYHFNSGGEPKFITDLEYEELVDFHKKYYHPSNAHFFTYGDLDFTEHLKFVEDQVLGSRFERNDQSKIDSRIVLEEKRNSFIQAEEHFMPDLMSPADQQAKYALSFLCDFCPAENTYESFCLQILSALLLQGPNAPFYKSIIEAQVAPQMCPGAGFDHSSAQAGFTVGVQGIKTDDYQKVEDVLFATLEDVRQNGIDATLFEQTLHQVEFGAKKTRKNTGLMYIFHMVPNALHEGDPLDAFKIDEYSDRIREDFAKGKLFEGLIDKHLTKNKHYLKMKYSPDDTKAEKDEAAEKASLEAITAALTEADKKTILLEQAELKSYQDTELDYQCLPSVSLDDISREVVTTERETRTVGNVKVHFHDQPTNGISYVRIKANLKNLPERLRLFLPMFSDLLGDIGTKSTRYDVFNNKMLNCTSGLSVGVDKYSSTVDHMDLLDRHEQIMVSTGFLDRNTEKAFECLSEILATPNFDEPGNISDLVKMESINIQNGIGTKGLQYARSYSASGLKAFARSHEGLRSDIFWCQYAANLQNSEQPGPILNDAISNMQEIASYIFREENLEIAVHGNSDKFDQLQGQIENLLNSIKKENSRYGERHSDLIILPEFTGEQTLYKNFFMTPEKVNHCSESMVGPTRFSTQDYGNMIVLTELLTFAFLLPSIREKGGAYGAGCGANDSGIISFYSYRDPNCDTTFENFERGVKEVINGNFTQQQMDESKLLAFQKLDGVVEPSTKGLARFTRDWTDEHRANLRLCALETTQADLVRVAEKYMLSQMEGQRTSRAVFGSQSAEASELEGNGWTVQNPIDFLSFDYFDQWKN